MNTEQLLEAGIRAARQRQNEAARNIFRRVVEQSPNNEEALLWLARVTPEAEEKAAVLEQALNINPNNHWAQEQLRAAQAGVVEEAPATATAADFHAGPSLEVLTCPNCNGSLELRGGQGVKTVVCRYCESVLDLTAEQAAIIGQGDVQAKGDVPIELLMKGNFSDEPGDEPVSYDVIGWLRYQGSDSEETWEWDEYLMVSQEGQFRWLSYSPDEGFVLQQKMQPRRPFNPNKAKLIQVPPNGTATVTERDRASIIALAGELTWQGKVGDEIKYLEARRGEKYRYSVEYSKSEIELMGGRVVPSEEVAVAFGVPELADFESGASSNAFSMPKIAGCGIIQLMIVGIIVFVFCACALPILLSDSDDSTNRYVGVPVCPTPNLDPEVTPTPTLSPEISPTPCPTATPPASSSFDDDDDNFRSGGFIFFGGGGGGGGSSSGGGFSGGK